MHAHTNGSKILTNFKFFPTSNLSTSINSYFHLHVTTFVHCNAIYTLLHSHIKCKCQRHGLSHEDSLPWLPLHASTNLLLAAHTLNSKQQTVMKPTELKTHKHSVNTDIILAVHCGIASLPAKSKNNTLNSQLHYRVGATFVCLYIIHRNSRSLVHSHETYCDTLFTHVTWLLLEIYRYYWVTIKEAIKTY